MSNLNLPRYSLRPFPLVHLLAAQEKRLAPTSLVSSQAVVESSKVTPEPSLLHAKYPHSLSKSPNFHRKQGTCDSISTHGISNRMNVSSLDPHQSIFQHYPNRIWTWLQDIFISNNIWNRKRKISKNIWLDISPSV